MRTLRWSYPHGDPSLVLFDLAVRRLYGARGDGFPLSDPDPAVLNVGCLEEDWCGDVAGLNPGLRVAGIDWRIDGRDAMDRTLFPAASFDLIVALGSIEHIGLGYYGDPIDPDGDRYTAANIAHWLRPGGHFYCDVPWTPETPFVSSNRHWRCYDDAQISSRLVPAPLVEIDRFYTSVEPRNGVIVRPSTYSHPYDYCVVVSRKA